jgi:hypothetical protein
MQLHGYSGFPIQHSPFQKRGLTCQGQIWFVTFGVCCQDGCSTLLHYGELSQLQWLVLAIAKPESEELAWLQSRSMGVFCIYLLSLLVFLLYASCRSTTVIHLTLTRSICTITGVQVHVFVHPLSTLLGYSSITY